MFHRGRKECGPKNGKIKGKSVEKAPDYKVGKRRGARRAAPNRGKPQGQHGKRKQTARTARKRQRKNCNMQSCERAQPLSPFEVSPDGTGRRFVLENSGWRDPLGYHNAAKYPPSDSFHWPCIMRRRSLRLPSPKPFRNSDGNTGAFFRAENYRREFYVPKTGGLNVQVFALRVTFPEGTW